MKSTSQNLDQSIVDHSCILICLRTGLDIASWDEILDLTCSTHSPELELTLPILARLLSACWIYTISGSIHHEHCVRKGAVG
jgi:hypothetical protein